MGLVGPGEGSALLRYGCLHCRDLTFALSQQLTWLELISWWHDLEICIFSGAHALSLSLSLLL